MPSYDHRRLITENDSQTRSYVFRDPWGTLSPLIRAAMGLDRSWSSDGSCRHHPEGVLPTGATWWHGETASVGARLQPKLKLKAEMAAAALLVCQGCPVQYECATYAVEGSMQAGIWGVSSQNREWLQRLNPTLAVALIDEARTKAVPVEVHIRAARLR